MSEGFLRKPQDDNSIEPSAVRASSRLLQNRTISQVLTITCILFLVVFFLEKSKSFLNLVPLMRGEVSLSDGLIITTTEERYPIMIKKDDPYIAYELRRNGHVNSLFDQAAQALCSPDDTIVQIGANYGFNTILLGKRLSGAGRIYAYEPNPFVYNCLRKNVYLNDLDTIIECKDVALSDHDGECIISDIAAAKLSGNTIHKGPNITVKCTTIDELQEERIALLLINASGYEFRILDKAHHLIDQSPSLKIIIKFRDTGLNGSEEKALDFLNSRGFFAYEVAPGPKFIPIAREDLVKREVGVVVFSRSKIER